MEFRQIRGATSIVTFGGIRFLIDPFFAPKGTVPPVPSPHNETPNPLVDLPIPAEEIVDVDAVIVTHMHHFDHFDPAAASALPKGLPVFVQNGKEADDMCALGFADVTALSAEGTAFRDAVLYRTEAMHGRPEKTLPLYAMVGIPADACGVVFTAKGEKTVYLAGDTILFEGVKEALARFSPDVVVLNAAWAQFWEGTPILMGPDDIVETVRSAPQARFIATHMDAVNHARLDRAGLRAVLAEQGMLERFAIPEDGESLLL